MTRPGWFLSAVGVTITPFPILATNKRVSSSSARGGSRFALSGCFFFVPPPLSLSPLSSLSHATAQTPLPHTTPPTKHTHAPRTRSPSMDSVAAAIPGTYSALGGARRRRRQRALPKMLAPERVGTVSEHPTLTTPQSKLYSSLYSRCVRREASGDTGCAVALRAASTAASPAQDI